MSSKFITNEEKLLSDVIYNIYVNGNFCEIIANKVLN